MKIIKNYFLNSSYQLLVVMLPIITIPYISRVLGPEGVGVNTFTFAIIQYFILIGNIGITTYGNREIAYNQGNKKTRSQIFWEIAFLRFITVGISILLFMIFLGFQKANLIIYLLQSIALIASAFDISWYFMGVEKFSRTVGRNFLVSTLSVILIFLFVKEKSDLPLYIIIITGSMLVGNLSLWPTLKKEVELPNLKMINISHHLLPTIQLFLPQIAIQIYAVANKNMLGVFDSMTAVGYFNQSNSIILALTPFVTSLGTVMLPRVSNMFAEGDNLKAKSMLKKSFEIMTAISIPMVFGVMGIALKFAPFFFGKDFTSVGLLMMIQAPIILFMAWSNVIGVQYLLPFNRLNHFTISVSIGAVLNVAINLVAIPVYGVVGAMVATVIAEFSVAVYQLYVVRKEFNILSMIIESWKYLFSGIIMFIVVYCLNEKMTMNIYNLVLQILAGGIIYVVLNIILKTNIFFQIKNMIFRKIDQ
ncbi:flippase [Lactococcus cremoris]|uniref:Repeat unit transporter n=1 Tax=Lactococcus cremoris subsp. tructae TaxID=542833 RepID=A0A2A5SSK6_LACLC|nr:flippase [Lactococcus cremoris]PCS18129.1 repeat unit transporter [Lactococcus cremoris subsp. tructae]